MSTITALWTLWVLWLFRTELRDWFVETYAAARMEAHLRIEREMDARLWTASEELREAEGRPERKPLTFHHVEKPYK